MGIFLIQAAVDTGSDMHLSTLLWMLAWQAASGHQSAGQRHTVLADSKELAASARLIEAGEEVSFEISAPAFVFPSVAVDLDRNGKIDPETDFSLSVRANGAPCLQRLLGPRKSSACTAPAQKAQVQTSYRGEVKVTQFTFPKRGISSDGSGFGFVVSLWNEKGKYDTRLASGEYIFGGSFKDNGSRTFLGSSMSVPGEILPALGRYQECLRRALGRAVALEPVKFDQVRATPTRCAAARKVALSDGIAALVAAGAKTEQASAIMGNALDQIDAQLNDFIKSLESKAAGK